jgi:hypothetical protein
MIRTRGAQKIGSALKYGGVIYRCKGFGTYHLYNLEDKKLTLYDLEAGVEEERNLIGRRLKPLTGSRKC